MKFLCGRPGCGKESTATLQIDAPSTTVSLVDPRISRDGVPLCARHADATTPPLGWTMNDLRSRNRALAAVPDEGSAPTSTPPRVRPDSEELAGRRMSRRQSIAERARRLDAEHEAVVDADLGIGTAPVSDDHKFTSSRPGSDQSVPAVAEVAPVAADGAEAEGPASRPSRRREVGEEAEVEEDRFPWHFQFDHDEPEELQASSPLLSRAFRATIG